jgi:hypothetical protein
MSDRSTTVAIADRPTFPLPHCTTRIVIRTT